jgi:anti-sigma factor RsiW
MNCHDISELMPDLAAGINAMTNEARQHLETCPKCSGDLQEFRRTMALLDEWQAPEPSPYFDTRLRARLREEAATQPAGWMQWFRRPTLAISLAVLMVVGITLFPGRHQSSGPVAVAEPGTAVGDLQALDKNHDLYSDFDLLDDLQVQHDVAANP